METPNDIDHAIIDARLEGLNQMYSAAVQTYRQGILDALCGFAREFVPGVHAVRLTADVDWRWTFDGWLDKHGNEIEHDFGDGFFFEELFDSSYLSELDDFESATGYVYVTQRTFCEQAEQVEQVEHEVESSTHFHDEHGLSREERERHYGEG